MHPSQNAEIGVLECKNGLDIGMYRYIDILTHRLQALGADYFGCHTPGLKLLPVPLASSSGDSCTANEKRVPPAHTRQACSQQHAGLNFAHTNANLVRPVASSMPGSLSRTRTQTAPLARPLLLSAKDGGRGPGRDAGETVFKLEGFK
eukprot:1195052-Prorocentrum_minimum.AAC.3